MAEMQFDLVSPERRLASLAAQAVEIPGADGDMTVMADHAPTITTLRPGLIRVDAGNETQEYVISGGFAEISAGGISILAEKAFARADMQQSHLDEMIETAHAAYQSAKTNESPVDDLAKLISDMVTLGAQIGLDPKQPGL